MGCGASAQHCDATPAAVVSPQDRAGASFSGATSSDAVKVVSAPAAEVSADQMVNDAETSAGNASNIGSGPSEDNSLTEGANKETPTPQGITNVEETVELSATRPTTGSTFYLIRHTFKSEDDASAWWKVTQGNLADKKALGEWTENVGKLGFHNAFFLPTANGTIYCLWEAKEGKTERDMQEFIDQNPISPTWTTGKAACINDVMSIPLALLGGDPPVKPFFGEHLDAVAHSDDENLQEKIASTFYLIKHDFTSKDDAGKWWEAIAKLAADETAVAQWHEKMAKDGFHNAAFLPTGPEGPMYCLWEAEAGKTAEDMAIFIDKSELSPTFTAGSALLINDVMQVVGPAPTHRFF